MNYTTLNLVNPDSSIKYEITKFPDGQQTLRILDEPESLRLYAWLSKMERVDVKSRLASFRDLELIICATQALRELGIKNISLTVPYVMGARSDRKFNTGGINYIRTVIAPIINSQGYESVFVLDPHSDVIEACINNCKVTSNVDFAARQIHSLVYSEGDGYASSILNKLSIISPDAGSNKKIKDVMKRVSTFNKENKATLINCDKTRELSTGKITGFEVFSNDVEGRHCVIVDDICDGGGTFIGLAAKLKDMGAASVYLVVTHGIFSKGIEPLLDFIDGVFTTDSFDHGMEHEKLVIDKCAFKYYG